MWICAFSNDLVRLALGVGTRMASGMNKVFFVPNYGISKGRVVAYDRLVTTLRPQKSEVHHVWCTVGGNKLDFTGITTTNCASVTTSKIFINRTLSTPNVHFLTL